MAAWFSLRTAKRLIKQKACYLSDMTHFVKFNELSLSRAVEEQALEKKNPTKAAKSVQKEIRQTCLTSRLIDCNQFC